MNFSMYRWIEISQEHTIRERGNPVPGLSSLPKRDFIQKVMNPELYRTVAPTKELCHHNSRELQGECMDPHSHSQTHTQMFCDSLH